MSDEATKGTELEQVPLKTDTDAGVDVPTTAPPLVETPKSKKTWFTWNKKKTLAANGAEVTVEEGNVVVEKPKKNCWWSKSCPKSEAEQKAEQLSMGLNLVDRDEKGINGHVQFNFDDIFGEADSQHSWDCVWRLIFKVFTWTRLFVYRVLSLIVAIPIAIVFGILFAIVSVLNVFACVPLAKLLSIPANWIAKTWNWLVRSLVDPVASSVGLIFSSCTIRKYGINSQPTDPLI
ncbi:unnamed protein product [Caenorhabditis auriculariae]|uniref:Caveolin n=1 Tax=Caenorhabditis auriculariae TaxID=2777116 RepID=A0A8S1HDY0_9PELO|nr:unnamed protein product [Caenorhabditis auriculariae]